jgi:hypothetical protein
MRKFLIAVLCVSFAMIACSSVFAAGPTFDADEEDHGPGSGSAAPTPKQWATDPDLPNRFKISSVVSAVLPSDDNIDVGISDQVMAQYDLVKCLALGLEVGYTYFDVHGLGVDWGKVHCIPVMGDAILKYPFEYKEYEIVPNLILGFGGLFTHIEDGSVVTTTNSTFSADGGFLFKLGTGVDVYVTDNLAIVFETSYQWSMADWQAHYSGNNRTINFDPSSLYLGGGLRLRF